MILEKKMESIEIESTSSKSWGTTSMILGIVGLILFIAPYIGIFMSIMATVFHGKQKKIGEVTGASNAGLIMGIIGIVLNSIMLIIVIAALVFASKMD